MTENQTDNDLLQRMNSRGEQTTDAFGTNVSKGTRNLLDLPAFYDFSEERYRFIENGSRIKKPDTNSTRFSDREQNYLIEPEAGDTLEFKTAEAPRYLVGNDASLSWSFEFLTALQDSNDVFRLFLDGAFEIEYDGADNVTFRTVEGGSEKVSDTVTPPNDLEDPSRPEITFNWYGVGRAELVIDYTANNDQQQTEPVILTVDDDWLSDAPVGRMGFELDVTNSGIQLEAGSMAYITQTDTKPTSRPKPHVFSSDELPQVAADGQTVLGALRIDPDRDNVFTNVTQVDVTAEASVDVELFLKAIPEGETDADFIDVQDNGGSDGPAYPRSNSPENSVIQWTPNVSTFPTRTYAIDGTEIPNGRNVGAATEGASGRGSGVSKTGRSFRRKRPIYKDDVVLMIAETPDASTATDVDVFIETDQEW